MRSTEEGCTLTLQLSEVHKAEILKGSRQTVDVCRPPPLEVHPADVDRHLLDVDDHLLPTK